MPKSNDLIIEAPRSGISKSPHIGFGSIRNLDLDTVPGIAQLNRKMFKHSSTTVTGLLKWAVRNPVTVAEVYVLDEDGVVYKSDDSGDSWAVLPGNITSSANGNGLKIWKDYLFVLRDVAVDIYGPLSGATFTVTIASPAVITDIGHGLENNDRVILSTTGTLPTGLDVDTLYYVINKAADTFQVSLTQGGAAINTSGSQNGTHTYTAWKTGFQIIDSDVDWHPMFISKNDSKLYGGAGRYVFSLDEVSGQTFLPGTAGTYTWTAQALDLPESYRIKCIEELGNNLMMGTWQGTAVTDVRVADIFPWDRSSVSFGEPVVMSDWGVHAMYNSGNSLVVLAGVTGTIFRSNGAGSVKIAQLPIDLSASADYLEWYPNGITSFKDKVYISVGNGGVTTTPGIGTYSMLETGQGVILNLEHTINLLSDGADVPVKITTLLPITQSRLQQTYQNDTGGSVTFGIEKTSPSSYVYFTDYGGYFESPLYVVGTINNKRGFEQLEFLLAKKLVEGEGIQFSYRNNLSDSYTEIKDPNGIALKLDFTKLGGVISQIINADIPKCEMLQIKVALSTFIDGVGGGTTPQFKSLRLR